MTLRPKTFSAALLACALAGCAEAGPHDAGAAVADAAPPESTPFEAGPPADGPSADGPCSGEVHFPVNPAAPGGLDVSCVGQVRTERTECSALTFDANLHLFLAATAPLANVKVEIIDADEHVLGTATSADGSDLRVHVPVGPEGFLGGVRLTADGVWPHDLWELARPVTADPGFVDGFTLDDALAERLVGLLGIPMMDKANSGLAIVRVVDCNGRLVEGATVDIDTPSIARFYMGPTGLPDPALTATTAFGGVAFPGVPAGPVRATIHLADTGAIVASGRGIVRPGHVTGMWAHPI